MSVLRAALRLRLPLAGVQINPVRTSRLCCQPLCSKRFRSTEAASVEVTPKIRGLVDEISGLTLLEVADLTAVLKKELNIADAAPMAFAPATGGAPAADAGGEAEAEEAKGPALLSVSLTGFKDDSKVKVIKAIKAILAPTDPKFNLAAAKKFVENLPGVLKEDISPEEAETLKEALEAAGGQVKLG